MEKANGEIRIEEEMSKHVKAAGFKAMFSARIDKGLGEDHLWLSLLTRPPQNPFTRTQRLTCCLSLLFAAMVTNAMFYNFGNAPMDTFKLGPISMSLTQIKIGIQSSLIALPINVLIVMLFKSVKPAKLKDDATPLIYPEKKSSGCLPHFFVYIAWILALLTSLTAATFVFFYSLMWGADTSNEWLISILVSFVQDILVIQPTKVLVLASLLSSLVRKAPKAASEASQRNVFEAGRNDSEEEDDHDSVPNREAIENARQFRVKFTLMIRALLEIVLATFFALLLMIVCYSNRDVSRYMLTQSMRNVVVRFNKVMTIRFLLNCFWLVYDGVFQWFRLGVYISFRVL